MWVCVDVCVCVWPGGMARTVPGGYVWCRRVVVWGYLCEICRVVVVGFGVLGLCALLMLRVNNWSLDLELYWNLQKVQNWDTKLIKITWERNTYLTESIFYWENNRSYTTHINTNISFTSFYRDNKFVSAIVNKFNKLNYNIDLS